MGAVRITEPHPSVSQSTYLHTGRGGAGNVHNVSPSSVTDGRTASGPASRTNLPPPPTNAYYMSGRGGAGNVHTNKERAIFSFDEELALQQKMLEHQAPVYHVGRGGAGNLYDERAPGASRQGSASSTFSDGSAASEKARKSIEGAWNRVRGSFSRQ